MTDSTLSAGTYEVLRNRLRDAAGDLRTRLGRLNQARSEVFGNIETSLLATERVNTQHHCTPRDLVAIGDQFLFGYNVQFGLKTEIELADVFSAYTLDDLQFRETSLAILQDKRFLSDFHDLYRFYKDTRFIRFFRSGPMLHIVFQVGKSPRDIKSFKWRVTADGIEYLDNRSEHEVRDPPQHEFRWTRTHRDQHHYGVHPHVSIDDIVFVETVGGDLTIKIENNTDTGAGIYAEPVDNPDQTLDDAEIHYAVLGNLVLMKVLPYQEQKTRYLIYNAKLASVMRVDQIEHACVMLPGDHGVIFPGGYYLQTGEFKQFEHGLTDMRYQRMIAAPNGEDYLYLFYNAATGTYVQLRYNLIRQTVDTPLVCHGQTFFQQGEMVCFRAQEEPSKHHAIQIWQTPFAGEGYVPENQTDSMLFKIGNKEIVRGMAECSELLQLIEKDHAYEDLYVDLAKKSADILDSYFWIRETDTQTLSQPIEKIRETAGAAVDEFEKVVRIRQETRKRTEAVAAEISELGKAIQRGRFDSIDDFVQSLAALRKARGHALGLKELRYVDQSLVETLEAGTAERSERLSRRCVDFLLTPGSLDSYSRRVAEADAEIAKITTVAQAKKLEQAIDQASSQLELLTETVSNLRIDDATKRTEIIDSISGVFASVNQVRSKLKAHRRALAGAEGKAEFASQLKLMEQTVAGYLDVADTPEKCDSYLTKVMVGLEELEGRFAEFDEFLDQLAQRREDVYAAFESRKVSLVEKRNRRAEALASAADRILKGIGSRVAKMESSDEIAAYFAGDLMVEKVRSIIADLQQLDDAVRVEDLQGRLKTIHEDANRQLRDRQDLYQDGGDLIRLGDQKFAVNQQPLDLTTVLRGGDLCLHLTGTQFFQPLTDGALLAARDLWDQDWVSENAQVYRGEYLAVDAFHQATSPSIQGRFDEGYAKGVHDRDAKQIHDTLLQLDQEIGLLRHQPSCRAAGRLWYDTLLEPKVRDQVSSWIGGFAKLSLAFPDAQPARQFRQHLEALIASDWDQLEGLFPAAVHPQSICHYLFDQLVSNHQRPVISQRVVDLYRQFCQSLPQSDRVKLLEQTISNEPSSIRRFVLARNWADAFLTRHDDDVTSDPATGYRDELAWRMICADDTFEPIDAPIIRKLTGLVGNHQRIESGQLTIHYHELLSRVGRYRNETVPRFRALHQTKNRLVAEAREAMRLDEFKPRVLTSFVRNRLLDEVYLPLIGDNLAKQMGAAGAGKRTDRMGLLLLMSPPGYGKTTLMEYIANRLGIVFVKINGPAIGHGVTSLDPDEAPNAAAREEVQRLNLALEMGDNVMLYLDDIQHTNPELLQKFISLCDATRKIEGVRDGKTRTYDLRGRRVAVVMAGNPYTESGDRFQVPDMLSNRADVYNLGEIIGDSAEAFEMSYLENAITSNAALAPLSTSPPSDARAIIQAAMRDSIDGIELESKLSMDQVREMFEVLRKLLRVRDAVLKVNRAYIRSAAQADAYRTEPPFKLQGSYRNMNRMAEKVAAVMNDAELQSLIVSSYQQDAQTLTTDNEANVLKFKELMGIFSPEEKERWDAIKYAYVESVRMAGLGSDDHAGQLMRQLASMRDGLESIRQVISKAVSSTDTSSEDRMDDRIGSIRNVLQSTSDQLQAIAKQQASDPPSQTVLVQHKVPRVLADLVKGQFHLMQEWLRPIMEGSIDNGRDLTRLQKQLESMMQNYRSVQDSFDATGKQEPS